ncbi:ATP-binding protein [Aurantimonas sp. A2-1-M11]|uniref:ATP-binding protein n=1 Tax=Aurantimonas sp. A2-1-M11 TaxID=3113712 RepID=UPI002F933780
MTVPEGSEEEPVVARARTVRARPVAFVLAIGLGTLALAVPEAALGCLAVFLLAMAVFYLPPRADRRGRGASAADRPELVWPGRGVKSVAEALQQPAFIIDRQMLLRYRNPASLIGFGNMALGDALSLRFRSPELLAAVETVLRDAQPGRVTIEERRPVERVWQVEILPIPPYQGERPHFYLILFSDRTAELRIERMRTDFVANASHELRTPLASLSGFIETLLGPARDDAVAREKFLGIMREQATRMSRLIDDLLSLSRVEMKRHVPVSTMVDLTAVLRKVETQLEPMAEQLGLELALDVPEEPVVIAGDEDELMQVFSNLVENACKYGESGTRVEMSLTRTVERGETYVDAAVRDFGPGIAAEHVPRLTERFYRVDPGRSRAKRGTGLGLSISRNILLRHRGRLLVESTIGVGSVFTARLPLPRGESGVTGNSSS